MQASLIALTCLKSSLFLFMSWPFDMRFPSLVKTAFARLPAKMKFLHEWHPWAVFFTIDNGILHVSLGEEWTLKQLGFSDSYSCSF